jgi:hypothetical protein
LHKTNPFEIGTHQQTTTPSPFPLYNACSSLLPKLPQAFAPYWYSR